MYLRAPGLEALVTEEHFHNGRRFDGPHQRLDRFDGLQFDGDAGSTADVSTESGHDAGQLRHEVVRRYGFEQRSERAQGAAHHSLTAVVVQTARQEHEQAERAAASRSHVPGDLWLAERGGQTVQSADPRPPVVLKHKPIIIVVIDIYVDTFTTLNL